MKKVLVGLGVFLLFFLVACNEVQDDLLTYLNEELDPIAGLEAEATEAYGSVTGANYTDDLTLYDKLTTVIIPTYEEFYTKLKRIDPETEEVQEVHDLFVEGVDDQYNAMLVLKTALEQQDPNGVTQANSLLDSGSSKINEYHTELEDLADEHDVEIEYQN
jgi:hypothetical protein